MRTFKPVTGFKPILTTYKFLSLLLIPSFIVISISTISYLHVIFFLGCTYGFITIIILIAQRTTVYQIDDNKIYYKSLLFFKGSIEIQAIYKIKLNAENWQSGMPATTNKGGISIFYNKFDELYLSPENNEKFVTELLKVNPTIEIINSK